VATYVAASWALSKDAAKRLAALETKVSRRTYGGMKANENWRQRYNKELVQLFGDLDILSFVRTSRLDWIGYANRMDRERKVIKYLTITLREVD